MYRQPAAQPKNRLPLLERVAIKTPCKASWNDMEGDDRVRFCCACTKNVYDLSAMSEDEAETFLAIHLDDEDVCVKLYRRPDGRILTADCPRGARTRHARRVAAAGAAVAFAVVAVASVAGDLHVPRAHPLPRSNARFEVPRRTVLPSQTPSEDDERATPNPAELYASALSGSTWGDQLGGISMLDEPAPPIPWGREHEADRQRIREAPSFTVDDGLLRAVVLRIVHQNFGRFRVAYERGLKVNPALAGRVVVRFTIGRDGSVVMASDGGSTLPDQAVVAEIVRSFLQLAFPQPAKGPMVVTLPLDLDPHGFRR